MLYISVQIWLKLCFKGSFKIDFHLHSILNIFKFPLTSSFSYTLLVRFSFNFQIFENSLDLFSGRDPQINDIVAEEQILYLLLFN